MIDSGARGNWGQITQLCGMKGLVANPAGKTIELPIKSNLKEGFKILEYFIATHGGRKGKSDTALKTAEAGYLTRRLVDSNQDIIVREYNCGSEFAHLITRAESEQIGEKFETRIYGRTLAKDLKIGRKTIIKRNDIVEKAILKVVEDNQIEEVLVRSLVTCKTESGVCVKCYGKDLGTNKEVQIGTAIGIIAAQSIGEPGTQLTMRTFHMGGVAEGADITQGLNRVEELFEARTPKSPAVISEIEGTAKIHQKGKITEISVTSDKAINTDYFMMADMVPTVKVGDEVKPKMVLAKAETHKGSIKSKEEGTVKKIVGTKIIISSNGPVTKVYTIPRVRTIIVKSKDRVNKGQPLTNGHLDLKQLLHLTDEYTVQKYIINEVQGIYASQGQSINDKHIEIIARQMLSKVRVMESGDTNFLPGEIVDIIKYSKANAELEKTDKKTATCERLLLGLTRIALYTDSWLSAASFQETIRVLVEASTTSRLDRLEGLKENVIIGKLIPAGATYRRKNPEIMSTIPTESLEAEPTEEASKEAEEASEEIEEKIEMPII